ncbi:acyl-CoA dehydrogenase family protein [Sphingobium baderi]|nr:acyl-CoA dehydrogenase family protein [Sphingobium baderi]ALR22283.1 acyl-CoA dehydrogenase [Sphingobium baderi]ARR57545.1 acyl-CoA dehydrogenase [Rhizorhabdus wittichii DC-6]
MTVDHERFGLTEQQELIRQAARRLAREVIAPTAAARDKSSAWPHEELKAVGELGFMGMMIPEEYGGSEIGFLNYALVIEELSAADAGLGTIVHVHNLGGAMPLYQLGSRDQRQKYLPAVARGELIGAAMLTEPHSGSDTAAFKTSARLDGDHYVLNGTKHYVSNGSEAGFALVLAVTDKTAGKNGFTTFLVDPKAPGVDVLRIEDKLGQHTAHTTQMALSDVRVPVENVVGAVGCGYRDMMRLLSDGRIGIAAQAVGIAQAALDAAVSYAKEREAYGKPIIELQGVAFKLAEMATEIDVARQYYRHVARMIDAGIPCSKEAAIAKLFASEMAERVCSEALQVHGGAGYTRDFPVERFLRDVRICRIYEGTSEIQKLIISRNL